MNAAVDRPEVPTAAMGEVAEAVAPLATEIEAPVVSYDGYPVSQMEAVMPNYPQMPVA